MRFKTRTPSHPAAAPAGGAATAISSGEVSRRRGALAREYAELQFCAQCGTRLMTAVNAG